jgi:hypothetical protein
MKYSITLETPFSFSARWYWIGAGCLVLAVSLVIAGSLLLKYLSDTDSAWMKRRGLPRNKKKYLKRIDEIESAYIHGNLDTRAVAQQMSREVRAFVDAVTGWQTNTMVCFELSRLNQPELAELVRYYYEPEFAYYSEADAKLAIERGKELIRKWA